MRQVTILCSLQDLKEAMKNDSLLGIKYNDLYNSGNYELRLTGASKDNYRLEGVFDNYSSAELIYDLFEYAGFRIVR